jgi:hypothetical protein
MNTLPFSMPEPADSRKHLARIGRVAAWVCLLAALIVPTIQIQVKTLENDAKAAAYDRKLRAGTLSDAERAKGPPKPHKGAINRWAKAFDDFWADGNIYLTADEFRQRIETEGPAAAERHGILHPNMPFTVILLSGFTALPLWAGGFVFTLVKVLAVLLCVFAVARVCNHRDLRMPDWVLGLGAAWWITLIISDIQHGNTNGLVLGSIVLHLWLYRRGNDLLAGGALALAICIKLTPALFVLYWLYQRNWKLLGGCLAGGVILAVGIPAAVLGPSQYGELMGSWMNNLIFKGLGGAWYPIHVNQSLPAVIGRFLLGDQPGGNIMWNPDDNPYSAQTHFQWIAIASLDPAVVKRIVQACQALLVLLAAGAIGWKRRPRNDARRGLHYAIVLTLMMLLNQRTWAHHAAVLLTATVAVWYAIAFGHVGKTIRRIALATMLLAGLILWGTTGELVEIWGHLGGLDDHQAELFTDRVLAYGPDFLVFLLVYVSALLLSFGLRRRETPYADHRLTLADD